MGGGGAETTPAAGTHSTAGAALGGEAGGAGAPGETIAGCELLYEAGHGDLFVDFSAKIGLSLAVRSAFPPADKETLVALGRVCVVVPHASLELAASFGGRPEGAQFDFIGVPPGASFWLLPAVAERGMPLFGASTERLPPSQYEGDELELSLSPLEVPEGANVACWTTDALGKSAPLFSSEQGRLKQRFSTGVHMHFNWSFSHEGTYRLAFEAKGKRVPSGAEESSGAATLRFEVRP